MRTFVASLGPVRPFILADLPLRIFAMFLNKTAETFLQIQLLLSERLC